MSRKLFLGKTVASRRVMLAGNRQGLLNVKRGFVYDEISAYCGLVCLLHTDIWGEVVAIRGRSCGAYEILLEATSKHVCMSMKATLSEGNSFSLFCTGKF